MWSRRRIAVSFLLALLALTVLFGCRAFVPEVVVVNKPPETYITGAPAESSGGYYHFHVFWYGTDEDGGVARFVWALTDSTVQNHSQLGDEEDTRFNPATNVRTLSIGHWTTRTDTIFDFQIRLGSTVSGDMTLHMVAVDDRGDYDRTPARLHFISNALSNPVLTFYSTPEPAAGYRFANLDTVAYGRPFDISWSGTTQNIRSYSPALLAQRDTIPPVDGLFGFKHRLLDVPCNDTSEDCWQPRAGVDSVSYFSPINRVHFANDGSGTDVRRQRLGSAVHRLLVNTIDMAGVEVPETGRALNYVVNYDPDTRILRGQTDPLNPSDEKIYPYYRVFYPDRVEEHPFAEGDTVPDRAYVVFKAIGWDDKRDLRTGTKDWEVKFQAAFDAIGLYGGQSRFPFSTQYSDTSRTRAWEQPGGGAADTVGFLVGPFEYTVTMRTIDEHGRRDGTPETFHFMGDFTPCVQCVEALVGAETPAPDGDLGCRDAACQATVDTLFARRSSTTPVPSGWRAATSLGAGLLWYSVRSGAVWLDTPTSTVEPDSMPGFFFEYQLALHGKDNAQEPWQGWPTPRPQDRIKSWNYQVTAVDRDPNNAIADGGGIDNILFTTFNREMLDPLVQPPQRIAIDDEGVWILRFKFFVPEGAMLQGQASYINDLRATTPNWQRVYELTTGQLGLTEAQFRANDASNCAWYPERSMYYYYTKLRVPDKHGLDCYGDYTGVQGHLRLSDFGRSSARLTKQYVLKVVPNTGAIFP